MQNGVLGDVLDGFHHAGEELSVGRFAGCEGNAAVAEQRRGHAVPGDGRYLRVPADLRIEMRVQVDEAGGDVQTARVYFLLAFGGYLADLDDGVAVDGDIRAEGFGAGAVHHAAAANN